MTMNTSMLNSIKLPLLALVAVAGLSACSSIGYRCPLDPSEKPESPTACAGMQEAMAGAKQGAGGKTSVFLDEEGRLVPQGLREGEPAIPLAARIAASGEPYRDASGAPVFHQPKVFKTWSAAFVDENGNLHDGHNAWFSTPGRWAYGTVNNAGTADMTMRPAVASELPKGRVATPAVTAPGQQGTQVLTQQQKDQMALQNLSAAANSLKPGAQQPQAARAGAPVVTAPGVGLAD